MAFIIAQILGLFGAITIIVSTQMKDKKKYIACNLLAYLQQIWCYYKHMQEQSMILF